MSDAAAHPASNSATTLHSLNFSLPAAGLHYILLSTVCSPVCRCGIAPPPWKGIEFVIPKKESIELLTEPDGSKSCWVLILSYKVLDVGFSGLLAVLHCSGLPGLIM